VSETIVVGIISGAAALLGAGIGGLASFAAQRVAQREARRQYLTAALAEFVHALDLMELEIRRMPSTATVVTRLMRAVDRRFPSLGFLIDEVNRVTLGRESYRTLDRFWRALSRLVLVAPPEFLADLEHLQSVLNRLGGRDDQWFDDWNEARQSVIADCRRLTKRSLP
jgi:hypothetical protein